VSLHAWLGRHTADLQTSHWQYGQFVSACTHCKEPMIKLPGQPWRLMPTASRRDRDLREGRFP
jgi:hypothetical protein